MKFTAFALALSALLTSVPLSAQNEQAAKVEIKSNGQTFDFGDLTKYGGTVVDIN